jgi:Uncharacterized protein conserved in bacteria (DUF2219).
MTNGRSLVAALLLLAVPALLFGQPPADLLCMKELASALKLDSASVPSASCRELGAYKQRSLSIFLEEDFLQRYGSTSDRNYTMGLGVGLSGSWITRRNMDLPLRLAEHSVDWALGLVKIDHFIARRNLEDLSKNRAYSLMLSGTAFTPKDLRADAPVVGDRPYAFMLGWTTSRATGDADSDDAYLSDFTFGTIGSEIGRNAQRFIHSRSRASSHEPTPYDPKGWANQIYDHALFGVGMPTARYGLVKMHRLAYVNTNTAAHTYLFDATQELGGDLGYYTDANFGLRVRAGLFSIPFWAWREDPLTSGSRGVADDAHACVASSSAVWRASHMPGAARVLSDTTPSSKAIPVTPAIILAGATASTWVPRLRRD